MISNFRTSIFCLMLLFGRLHAGTEGGDAVAERIIRRVEELRGVTSAIQANRSEYGGKCGLRLSFEVMEHWNEFNPLQQRRLLSLLIPPDRQKSRTIGHFTFFYDTTGTNAPSLSLLVGNSCQRLPNTAEQYVDSAGKYFNYAWTYEIDTLGYGAPPLRTDGTYWIEIRDLGYGLYGQTFYGMSNQLDPLPIDQGPPARYKTYIEVDNDYCGGGYVSQGIAGLRVTSAHEFHHAIQLGFYGTWGIGDLYFNEVTSTWMEDVVHDDVNDYYQYLSNSCGYPCSQFSTPDVRFSAFNGTIEYSRAIWGKFIEKRFSRDVMRHTWEYERQFPSLEAIDHALRDAGSSLRQAFLEWSVWNGNTGANSDTSKYYAEGRNYPTMLTRAVVQYDPPQKIVVDTIQALSSVYHPIIINGIQMMVIVSNLNSSASASLKNAFTYSVSAIGDETSKHLSNGVYVKLSTSDPENWSTQENVPSVVSEVLVFPNPYISRGQNFINFRLPPVVDPEATLAIFNDAMGRIMSRDLTVSEFHPSEPSISWDGHDEQNNPAPSGVYFYVITVDAKQYMGKFVLIRE